MTQEETTKLKEMIAPLQEFLDTMLGKSDEKKEWVPKSGEHCWTIRMSHDGDCYVGDWAFTGLPPSQMRHTNGNCYPESEREWVQAKCDLINQIMKAPKCELKDGDAIEFLVDGKWMGLGRYYSQHWPMYSALERLGAMCGIVRVKE